MSKISKFIFICIGLVVPVTALQAQERDLLHGEEINTTAALPFGGDAVSDEALHTMKGQADLSQVIAANNNAVVSGNSVAGQSVTGAITIDGQAFQNMSGLSVLSANSGNNVSINASMNVNVAIYP